MLETAFSLLTGKSEVQLPDPVLDALTTGRLPHALLLVGTAEAAKSAARYIAQVLLCERESRPCGNCSACVKFAAGVQTDFFEVGDASSIKTRDVESLQDWLTVRGHSGQKVYTLYGVDSMTGVAANRILKTLEEPEQNVYALLTTANRQAVLSTILSRCFTYNVYASEMWADSDHQSASLLQSAVSDAENSSFDGFIDKMIKWTEMWLVDRQPALILAARWQSICGELSAELSLMLFLEWLRDILHTRIGGSNIRLAKWISQIARIAPILEVSQWTQAIEIVLNSRQRLDNHVAVLLNLEQMCIRLRGVLPDV